MPKHAPPIPDSAIASLMGSGFPFQTAVRNVIESSAGWSIRTSEYPWQGPKDEDRFLDIIAINQQFILTVECKKTKEDTLIFLDPHNGATATPQTSDFQCLSWEFLAQSIPRYLDMECKKWEVWPQSPSCEFCIVVGTKHSERLLERDASLVVRATEALAQDGREMIRLSQMLSRPFLFLPVIITNARLLVAHYRPTDISLESGQFKKSPNDIEHKVPWVRFSKAFTASKSRDFSHRSVFVVGATHLEEFLNNLELPPS
jgi:hypothetical protein